MSKLAVIIGSATLGAGSTLSFGAEMTNGAPAQMRAAFLRNR
jgi:hypothetical protein